MIKVYKGKLKEETNTETEILKLEDEILAEVIQSNIEEHGNYLSVQYYTSDIEVEDPKKEFIKELYGIGEAKYHMNYSDITGYLWTDEDLVVGGHDLIDELRGSVGRYLYLSIEFNKSPKVQK